MNSGIDAIDQRLPNFLPLWESIDLQDYRNRYATYSRDEALQNLVRRVPLMAIWDDHELSDNASGDENRCVPTRSQCEFLPLKCNPFTFFPNPINQVGSGESQSCLSSTRQLVS